MPELPEVETVRRALVGIVVDRTIIEVRATGVRTVRRYGDRAVFENELRGVTVRDVDRHGKYLLVRADDDRTVVIHLRMSGQLLRAEPGDPLARHTHVVFELDNGSQLRFVDPRTFGECFVSTGKRPAELAHLGPDAWEGLPSPDALRPLFAATRSAAKVLLTDQRFVAGIGNIYADEILFRAKVRPERSAESMRPVEIGRIHRAITEVLSRAIELGGSTLRDQQYVDPDGIGGGYQHEHAVYGRSGEPCGNCGQPIRRVAIGARSAFACRRCQR